ncbi:MAG: nucleoprotein [hymenopteran phasma-related virus OKIAV228]|uniref:nucleoprotein n=1 Tax=hymenopteran phasma-related virus OKIAV228 TaxID=2847800 RepID=UPI002483F5FC|nr:MAG: nucleoprotein [hymenopteran phasma-related virus OKIAV228]WBM84621.1 MAG: nucleoprotein [hymenopteran phasma-related virus OKIAV228]
MANYDVTGTKPASLLAHGMSKEYIITGITPADFIKIHGGLDFNYESLMKEFKKHCFDFNEDLALNMPSMAVEFCSKVIFEIGPDSRKVKKGTGDKVWKFIFSNPNDRTTKHVVFIATFKQENASFVPDNSDKHMILTLKQAGLLALETFSRLIVLGYSNRHKLMTPLAGACFSKDDTEEMAKELGMDEPDLLAAISKSTQSGGQYLNGADIDIAICASISATRNVKDDALKKSIVTKVVKQYMNRGFKPDKGRIGIIARYATGGIPTEFSYDELVKFFDMEQSKISAIRMAKAIAQSPIPSQVFTPGSSK